MFTVEVEKTKNVSILKKLIKEEKATLLNHVDASDLDIWNVSIPRDVLTSVKYGENLNDDVKALGLGQSLDSMETLLGLIRGEKRFMLL